MGTLVRTKNLFIAISLVKLNHSHRKYKFYRRIFLKCKLQCAGVAMVSTQTASATFAYYSTYCLLRSTFPTPLILTQMCLVFEVLYLAQFLMDSLESWTAHSPIYTLDV